MSELLAPFGVSPDAIEDLADAPELAALSAPPADADPVTRTPVLISEQQVLFASAAAVPLRPAKTSRPWADAVRVIGATLRAVFMESTDDTRPKPRHYPPRNDYLESSRMAREMYRL